MQVPDATPGVGDRLALDLQDQPQHPVRGRMLGPHVDDDAFAGIDTARGFDDLVPVLATGDHEGLAGAVVRRFSGSAHQLYALRSSGGGICAPLYSTGIPPRG